ncbi:fasciclin domain-containing protein [Calothrix sp. FACHB-1219]|uniref:fasciclin domain-containing protein n=1 Tax=unclassified Calothrix TaxID=2619626 RepID=UPI0016821DE4|nr:MULTISPECIES: fasciclin domain-containing protein [unclassified Calothrix]MBD2203082.1 fasciclin domain-containing protein [Calothrix sp. FACHB-168]MBD2218683.1 fasciclin domain-containing protein [Calothrix sp. FACHB-1219]
MKANYSQLLTSLAGIVGIAGSSFLINLPSQAEEATNPNPTIFSEAPYNRTQRIDANANYTPVQSTEDTAKGATSNRNLVAQKPNKRGVNPRPSIFNEPPYNRGSRTAGAEVTPTSNSTPEPKPSTPATEVPATPATPVTPVTPATPVTPTPNQTTPGSGSSNNNQDKNLVTLAQSNASFSTLTKALQAAGLTDTLAGKENYTIFAPTDAAFAKLPPDAVRDLLKPENKEVLVKILTYHVVPGKVLSTDLKSGEVKSIEGGAINVKVDPKAGVTVNDAKVTEADITGSNGVIHAIDQVILPPDL